MKASFVKFYFVGFVGVLVQLGTLTMLISWLGTNPLLATAVAVETAVVHNFIWHDRWTWPGRPASERLRRFLLFNVSNGAISIVTGVAITGALISVAGMPYAAANALAIAAASVANYVAGERYVFAVRSPPYASATSGSGTATG